MATKKQKRTEDEWMWIYENKILKEDAAFDRYLGGCFHVKPYWYKDNTMVKKRSSKKNRGKKSSHINKKY